MARSMNGSFGYSVGLVEYEDCPRFSYKLSPKGMIRYRVYCRRHNCANHKCQKSRLAEICRRIEMYNLDKTKQWVMITLTIPNISEEECAKRDFWKKFGNEVYETCKSLYKQFILFPETNFNPKRNDFHPHFHCICVTDVPIVDKDQTNKLRHLMIEMGLWEKTILKWHSFHGNISLEAQDCRIIYDNRIYTYLMKYLVTKGKENPKVHYSGLRYFRSNQKKVDMEFVYNFKDVGMIRLHIHSAGTLDKIALRSERDFGKSKKIKNEYIIPSGLSKSVGYKMCDVKVVINYVWSKKKQKNMVFYYEDKILPNMSLKTLQYLYPFWGKRLAEREDRKHYENMFEIAEGYLMDYHHLKDDK